jgi:hypothetical protein
MQKGSLPAAISLAHKFGPASRTVLIRSFEAIQVRLILEVLRPAFGSARKLKAFYDLKYVCHLPQAFATHLPEHASRAQQYLASTAPVDGRGAEVEMAGRGSSARGEDRASHGEERPVGNDAVSSAPASSSSTAAAGLTQRKGVAAASEAW